MEQQEHRHPRSPPRHRGNGATPRRRASLCLRPGGHRRRLVRRRLRSSGRCPFFSLRKPGLQVQVHARFGDEEAEFAQQLSAHSEVGQGRHRPGEGVVRDEAWVEARPLRGGRFRALWNQTGGDWFYLYPTPAAGTAHHTAVGRTVTDLEAMADELGGRECREA